MAPWTPSSVTKKVICSSSEKTRRLKSAMEGKRLFGLRYNLRHVKLKASVRRNITFS